MAGVVHRMEVLPTTGRLREEGGERGEQVSVLFILSDSFDLPLSYQNSHLFNFRASSLRET